MKGEIRVRPEVDDRTSDRVHRSDVKDRVHRIRCLRHRLSRSGGGGVVGGGGERVVGRKGAEGGDCGDEAAEVVAGVALAALGVPLQLR